MLEFVPASLHFGDVAVNDTPVYHRLRIRNREAVPVVVQLSASSPLLRFQLYNENLHTLETSGPAELSASYDRAFDLVGLITAVTLAGQAEQEIVVSFYADPSSFPHLLAQTPPLTVHETIHLTATTTTTGSNNGPLSLSRRPSESPLLLLAAAETGGAASPTAVGANASVGAAPVGSPVGSPNALRRITSCIDGMNTTQTTSGSGNGLPTLHSSASLMSSPTMNTNNPLATPTANITTTTPTGAANAMSPLAAVRAETLSVAVTARVFLSFLQLSTSELRATMSANRTQILDFTVTNLSCSALTFVVRDQSMHIAGLEVALFIAERFEEPQLGRRISLESGGSVHLSLIVRTAGAEVLSVPQEVQIVLQCDNLRDARNTALLLVNLSLVSELQGDLVTVNDTSVDFHEVYRGASTRAELGVMSHELREDVVLRLGHVSRRTAEGSVLLCRLVPSHTLPGAAPPQAALPHTASPNMTSTSGHMTGPDGNEMACVVVDELLLPSQASAHFLAASQAARLQAMGELGYMTTAAQASTASLAAAAAASSRQVRFALLYSPALSSSASSTVVTSTTSTSNTAAGGMTTTTAAATSAAVAGSANAEMAAIGADGAGGTLRGSTGVSPLTTSLGHTRSGDAKETAGLTSTNTPSATNSSGNTNQALGGAGSNTAAGNDSTVGMSTARHAASGANDKARVRFDVELIAATASGSRQQRLLLRCQATLYTSRILVHPLVLNFGDCAVGQSKRLSFSIENQAALPGRVLVQIRSKIITIEGVAAHVGPRSATLDQGGNELAASPGEVMMLLGNAGHTMSLGAGHGRELCESFTIAPLSTLPMTLRIAPQRVNPLYRKQLTVVNAATRQEDRVIVTIESNNMAPPEAKRHNELYTWDYVPFTDTTTSALSQNIIPTNTVSHNTNNANVSANSSMGGAVGGGGGGGLEATSSGSHHDENGSFATGQADNTNNNTNTNTTTAPPPPATTTTTTSASVSASLAAAVPPVFYAITNLPLVIPYVVQSKTDHPLRLHVESTSSEVEVFLLNTPERAAQLDALAAELRAYALYEDVEDIQGDWLRSHASRVEFARRDLLAFLAEHALFVPDLTLPPRGTLRVYAIIIRSSPTTEALSKEDGLSIFVDGIEAPRFIRLSYKVCSSVFELNGQKTKNFGEVNIGTRRSTKLQVVNRCQAVLFLRLSKSRSVTAGHLRVEHSDRQVITLALRPYATREIEVTFYPGIKGGFDESIRLVNVLDPRNHTTVTLKATVIKADTFEVSPDAWSFGAVTVPARITRTAEDKDSSTGAGEQHTQAAGVRKASVRVGARFMVCNTSQTRRQIHLRLDPSALLASLAAHTNASGEEGEEVSTTSETAHLAAEEAAAYLRAEAETEEGNALRRILSRAMDALRLPGAELQVEIEMQLCGSSSGSTRKIAEEIERLEQKLKIYKRKKKAEKTESALRRIAVLKRALQGEGVDLDAPAHNEGSTQAQQTDTNETSTKQDEDKDKTTDNSNNNHSNSKSSKDAQAAQSASGGETAAAPAASGSGEAAAAAAQAHPQNNTSSNSNNNNNSHEAHKDVASEEMKERMGLIRRRVTAAELLSLLLRDGVALPLMAAGESVSILLELRCTRLPHEAMPPAQTITFNLFLAEAKDQEINRIVPVDITLLRHPDDTMDELPQVLPTAAVASDSAKGVAAALHAGGAAGGSHPLQDRPLHSAANGGGSSSSSKALVAAQNMNAGRQSVLRVSWPSGGAVQPMGTSTFMGYPLLALSNCIVNDRVEFVLHVRASAATTCVVLEPRRCTSHNHIVQNQGSMLDAQFKFYPRNGPVGGNNNNNNNSTSTGVGSSSSARVVGLLLPPHAGRGPHDEDDQERESVLRITVDCTPRSVGPQKYFLPLKNLHNPADIAYVVVEMNPSLEEELITTEPKLLQFSPVITPCLLSGSGAGEPDIYNNNNNNNNISEEHHEAQLLFIRSRFPSSHVLLVRSTLPSQIRFFEDAQCRVPLQQPLRRTYVRESIRVYVQFRPSPRSCESRARTIHAGILIEALATTRTQPTSTSTSTQHTEGNASHHSSSNATPANTAVLSTSSVTDLSAHAPMASSSPSSSATATAQATSFTIVGRAVVPCTVCVGSGVLRVVQSRLELGTIAASERHVRTNLTIENPSDTFCIRASLVAAMSRICFDPTAGGELTSTTATNLLTAAENTNNSNNNSNNSNAMGEAYRDAFFSTAVSRVGSPAFRTPTTSQPPPPPLFLTGNREEGENERATQLELTLRPRETRQVPLTLLLPSPGYVETSVLLYNRSCRQAPQRIGLSALRPDDTVTVYLNGTAMGSSSSSNNRANTRNNNNNNTPSPRSQTSAAMEDRQKIPPEALTLRLPMAAVVRCDAEGNPNEEEEKDGSTSHGSGLQLYSVLHAASSSAAYYNARADRHNNTGSSSSTGHSAEFDAHVPVRIVNRGAQDMVLVSRCEMLPLDFVLDGHTGRGGGEDTTRSSPRSLRAKEEEEDDDDDNDDMSRETAGPERYRHQSRRGHAMTCYTTPTMRNAPGASNGEADEAFGPGTSALYNRERRVPGQYYTPTQPFCRRQEEEDDDEDTAVHHSSSSSSFAQTRTRSGRRADSTHEDTCTDTTHHDRVLVKAHSAVYVRWRLAALPSSLRGHAELLLHEHGMVTIAATIQLRVESVSEKAGLALFARRRAANAAAAASASAFAPRVGQCVALIPVSVSFAMSEGCAQPGQIELGVVGLGRQGGHGHAVHSTRGEAAATATAITTAQGFTSSNNNERRGRQGNATGAVGHHPMIAMQLMNLSPYLPLRLRAECPPTIRLAGPRFFAIAPGQRLAVHGHVQLAQLPTQGPFRLDACFVNELNPENDITVRITGQYLSKVFQLLSQVGEEMKGSIDFAALQVDCGGTLPLMLAERKFLIVALGHDVEVEVQIRMNPRLENLLELQLLSHDAMTRADTLQLSAASTPMASNNNSSAAPSISPSLLSAAPTSNTTSSAALPAAATTLPALSLSTSNASKAVAGTPASGTPLSSLAASMSTTTNTATTTTTTTTMTVGGMTTPGMSSSNNNNNNINSSNSNSAATTTGSAEAHFVTHSDPLHAMSTRHTATNTSPAASSRRKALGGGIGQAQTGQKLRLRCVLRKANLAALAAVFYGSGRRKQKSVTLLPPGTTPSEAAANSNNYYYNNSGESWPTFDQLPEYERARQRDANGGGGVGSSSHSVWLGTLVLSNRITAEEEIEIYGQLQRFQTFSTPAKATLRPFHLPGWHVLSSSNSNSALISPAAPCATNIATENRMSSAAAATTTSYAAAGQYSGAEEATERMGHTAAGATAMSEADEETWSSTGRTSVRSAQAAEPARQTLLYAGELTLRNACVAVETVVQLAAVMSDQLPVPLIVELVSAAEAAHEEGEEKAHDAPTTHHTASRAEEVAARRAHAHSPAPPPSPSARSGGEDAGFVSTTFTNTARMAALQYTSTHRANNIEGRKPDTVQPAHVLRLRPGASRTVYVLIRAADAAAQDALQHVFLEQYVAIAMRDANIGFAVGVTRFSVIVGGGLTSGVANAADEPHTTANTAGSREAEALLARGGALTSGDDAAAAAAALAAGQALHQALNLGELQGEYMWLEQLLRARLPRSTGPASRTSSIVSHQSASSVPDLMSHTQPPATTKKSEVVSHTGNAGATEGAHTTSTSNNSSSSMAAGTEGHPLQDTSLAASEASVLLAPHGSAAAAAATKKMCGEASTPRSDANQRAVSGASTSLPSRGSSSPDTTSAEALLAAKAETPHQAPHTSALAESSSAAAAADALITPEKATRTHTHTPTHVAESAVPVLALRRCQLVPETAGAYSAAYTFAKDDPPDPEILICNNLSDRAVDYTVSITSQSPLPWLLLPSATGHIEPGGTQPLRLNLLAGEVGFFVGYIALYNTARPAEVVYLRLSAEIFIPGSGEGLFEVVTCNGVRVPSNSTRDVPLGHLYGAGSMRTCVALELVNRGNVPLEFPVSVVRPFRLTLRPLPADLLMRRELRSSGAASTSSGRLQRALMQSVKAAKQARDEADDAADKVDTAAGHEQYNAALAGEDTGRRVEHSKGEAAEGTALDTPQQQQQRRGGRDHTAAGHETHTTGSFVSSSSGGSSSATIGSVLSPPPPSNAMTSNTNSNTSHTNASAAPLFEGQLAVCHIHGVATMSGQRYIVVDPRSRVRLAFVLACESLQVAEGYGVSGTADVVFRCKQARDAVFTFRTSFDAFRPSFAVEREYVVAPLCDPTSATMSGGLARVRVANLLSVPQAFVFRTQSPILSIMAQGITKKRKKNTAAADEDDDDKAAEQKKDTCHATEGGKMSEESTRDDGQGTRVLAPHHSTQDDEVNRITSRVNALRLQAAPRCSVAELAIPPHSAMSFIVYLDLVKAATLTNQPRSAIRFLSVREHGVLLNLLNPRERVHVEVVHVASGSSECVPLLRTPPSALPLSQPHSTPGNNANVRSTSTAMQVGSQAEHLWRDAGTTTLTTTNNGNNNNNNSVGGCVEGGTMTSLSGALIPAPYYANMPVTVIRPVKSGTGQYFSEHYILCFAQRFSKTLTRYAVRLLTAFRAHAAARGETVTLPSFALGLNEAERETFRAGHNATSVSAQVSYLSDTSSSSSSSSSSSLSTSERSASHEECATRSSTSTYSSRRSDRSASSESRTPHAEKKKNEDDKEVKEAETMRAHVRHHHHHHSRSRVRRRVTERSADELAEEHNAMLNSGLPSCAWAKLHRLLVELTWLVDELLFYTILLRNSRLIDGYCVFLVAAVTNHVVMRTWWASRQLLAAATVPEYRIFAQYMEVLDELPCATPSLSGN